MAQIPGSDAPIIASLQATMIGGVGEVYGVNVTKAAADLLLTFTATMAGIQRATGSLDSRVRKRNQHQHRGGADRGRWLGCKYVFPGSL